MSGEHASPSTNGNLALHYAARGFYVFPCRSCGDEKFDKRPIMVRHWRDESTRDPETIGRWWRQHPDALVALDCCKVGIVVIDADRHGDAPDGVVKLMSLVGDDLGALGCPIVATPGNGLHLYFGQAVEGPPFGNGEGELAGHGINVRGDGGYIIAPGCVRYDGAVYRPVEGAPDLAEAWNDGAIPPVPNVLSQLIRAPKMRVKDEHEQSTQQPNRMPPDNRIRSYALTALEDNAAALAACSKGERNILLNNVALRAGRMVAPGWLTKEEAFAAFKQACTFNGYIGDKGLKAFHATFESGFNAGFSRPLPDPVDRNMYSGEGAQAFRDAFNDDERADSGGNQSKHEISEAPRPLFRPLPPAAKYPVEALGEILAPAARAIMDRVQCPDALAAQSVLAFASLAVQAHADVEIPATGHRKPVSLNMLAIASSGDRKSGADIEASWPIRKHEQALREAFNTDMKEYLKGKKAWDAAEKKALNAQKDDYGATKARLDGLGEAPAAPVLPMKTCPEPTYEGLCKALELGQPSMGIFSDEGGSFISGHGMSPDNRLRTIAGLSSLWDGSPIKRVRVGDGANILAGKRLAVYLMVQPDAAGRFLSDPVVRDQGFLSRFLISAPDSTAGTRFQREPHPESVESLKRYGARILSILDRPAPLAGEMQNELEPRVLPFDSDAAQAWRDFADHVERLLAPGQPFEPVRGFANKLPEHAARIAAVLTLVDDLYAHAISRETFERAVVLAEYYAHEALRLFGTGCASPELQRAEALRKWLLTRWDEPLIGLAAIYQKGPTTLRDAKTAKEATKVLVDHGWLIPVIGRATVEGKTVREAWKIVKEGGQ